MRTLCRPGGTLFEGGSNDLPGDLVVLCIGGAGSRGASLGDLRVGFGSGRKPRLGQLPSRIDGLLRRSSRKVLV